MLKQHSQHHIIRAETDHKEKEEKTLTHNMNETTSASTVKILNNNLQSVNKRYAKMQRTTANSRQIATDSETERS